MINFQQNKTSLQSLVGFKLWDEKSRTSSSDVISVGQKNVLYIKKENIPNQQHLKANVAENSLLILYFNISIHTTTDIS